VTTSKRPPEKKPARAKTEKRPSGDNSSKMRHAIALRKGGLVGLGKILEQPWAENGVLGIRPVLSATIAGDHRATDGRRGAQFLDALARHLREPEKL